jgi:hypothetical protein
VEAAGDQMDFGIYGCGSLALGDKRTWRPKADIASSFRNVCF